MSGLTPEQIQDWRECLLDLPEIQDCHVADFRLTHAELRALLDAAESAGKLEKLAESTPHRFTNAEELGPCDLCGCTGDDPIHREYASLRAQLAAREASEDELAAKCSVFEEQVLTVAQNLAAAEAEVEQLRAVLSEVAVFVETYDSEFTTDDMTRAARMVMGQIKSGVSKRLAALSPSVPPQTTVDAKWTCVSCSTLNDPADGREAKWKRRCFNCGDLKE